MAVTILQVAVDKSVSWYTELIRCSMILSNSGVSDVNVTNFLSETTPQSFNSDTEVFTPGSSTSRVQGKPGSAKIPAGGQLEVTWVESFQPNYTEAPVFYNVSTIVSTDADDVPIVPDPSLVPTVNSYPLSWSTQYPVPGQADFSFNQNSGLLA